MLPQEHPHWVLGDQAGRRVADYCTAAEQCGRPRPSCIDWLDVIRDGPGILDQVPKHARLRIDSFGQRGEVIASLIRHGGGNEFPQRGEILSLDHQYLGLCRVLRDLNDWSLNRYDVEFDQQPGEIAIMFDKWATHRRMLPHRPKTVLLPTERSLFHDELRQFIRDCRGRVFVKPRYASSASGVCCYRISNHRQQLIAPIEIMRDAGRVRLFNSLRVRSYTCPRDIQDIFSVLAPQGMVAESAVNKARVDGDRFDLRVVVISGRADHLVARQSASPITNLHLGNARASLDMVTEAVGSERLEACRQLALHAAARFPGTRYCGVDVLLPRTGIPLVCEVNAFGDFLPNLVAAGRTVYEAILKIDECHREVLV